MGRAGVTYSALIDSALIFAARAHQNQVRKGSDVPYIVHPVGVMLTLQAVGETDPELLAAALLHDTLEDAGVTVEVLAGQFGQRVAGIVAGASEPFSRDALWETRKQHTVAYLRTAPRDVQLVAAADKLHNLTSMVADREVLGEGLWTRFNRGPREIAWYYRAVAASLLAGELGDHPLVQRLAATVETFFGPADGQVADDA
jgi:(p)ppGpp synthase/HD superfamily hydrolase